MSRKKKILILLVSIILIVAFFFPKNSIDCFRCFGKRAETSFFADGGFSLCFGIPYMCSADIPIYRNIPRLTPTQSTTLTKQQALEKVRLLPEVQEYMEIVPNVRFMVEESSENPNIWTVRVFEDKETHTATFNWYEVNKETGEVKPVF